MIENEALHGKSAYTLMQLFNDTRQSIFNELYTGGAIDPYRRNLQRAYVDQMKALLMITDDNKYDQLDIKALARASLDQIKEDINKQLKKQSDQMSTLLGKS